MAKVRASLALRCIRLGRGHFLDLLNCRVFTAALSHPYLQLLRFSSVLFLQTPEFFSSLCSSSNFLFQGHYTRLRVHQVTFQLGHHSLLLLCNPRRMSMHSSRFSQLLREKTDICLTLRLKYTDCRFNLTMPHSIVSTQHCMQPAQQSGRHHAFVMLKEAAQLCKLCGDLPRRCYETNPNDVVLALESSVKVRRRSKRRSWATHHTT